MRKGIMWMPVAIGIIFLAQILIYSLLFNQVTIYSREVLDANIVFDGDEVETYARAVSNALQLSVSEGVYKFTSDNKMALWQFYGQNLMPEDSSIESQIQSNTNSVFSEFVSKIDGFKEVSGVPGKKISVSLSGTVKSEVSELSIDSKSEGEVVLTRSSGKASYRREFVPETKLNTVFGSMKDFIGEKIIGPDKVGEYVKRAIGFPGKKQKELECSVHNRYGEDNRERHSYIDESTSCTDPSGDEPGHRSCFKTSQITTLGSIDYCSQEAEEGTECAARNPCLISGDPFWHPAQADPSPETVYENSHGQTYASAIGTIKSNIHTEGSHGQLVCLESELDHETPDFTVAFDGENEPNDLEPPSISNIEANVNGACTSKDLNRKCGGKKVGICEVLPSGTIIYEWQCYKFKKRICGYEHQAKADVTVRVQEDGFVYKFSDGTQDSFKMMFKVISGNLNAPAPSSQTAPAPSTAPVETPSNAPTETVPEEPVAPEDAPASPEEVAGTIDFEMISAKLSPDKERINYELRKTGTARIKESRIVLSLVAESEGPKLEVEKIVGKDTTVVGERKKYSLHIEVSEIGGIPTGKTKFTLKADPRDRFKEMDESNNVATVDAEFPRLELSGCQELGERSGDPASKIDVVFVPDNYRSVELFADDARKVKNAILSTDPFSSNKNKFNFYYVSDSDVGLSVSEDDADSFNWGKVKSLAAANCKNSYQTSGFSKAALTDQVVVLANKQGNSFAGLGEAGVVVFKTDPDGTQGDFASVATHEFGHSFAGLLDEYVRASTIVGDSGLLFNTKFFKSSPNCDSDCKKWCSGGFDKNKLSKFTSVCSAAETKSECDAVSRDNFYCEWMEDGTKASVKEAGGTKSCSDIVGRGISLFSVDQWYYDNCYSCAVDPDAASAVPGLGDNFGLSCSSGNSCFLGCGNVGANMWRSSEQSIMKSANRIDLGFNKISRDHIAKILAQVN